MTILLQHPKYARICRQRQKTNIISVLVAGFRKPNLMPHPVEIKVHQVSRLVEIAFDNGASFKLPFEFLRVYSPSAEVRGHGPGQEVLQAGKKDVGVAKLEPVGNYAIQIYFSDGHNTGIYSWDYLHELGEKQTPWWNAYLERMQQAGASREAK